METREETASDAGHEVNEAMASWFELAARRRPGSVLAANFIVRYWLPPAALKMSPRHGRIQGVQGVRTPFRPKVPFFRPKVPFL
jgi:hypothetical protein